MTSRLCSFYFLYEVKDPLTKATTLQLSKTTMEKPPLCRPFLEPKSKYPVALRRVPATCSNQTVSSKHWKLTSCFSNNFMFQKLLPRSLNPTLSLATRPISSLNQWENVWWWAHRAYQKEVSIRSSGSWCGKWDQKPATAHSVTLRQ